MEEGATYDPQDGEFFKEFFIQRLRPIAVNLCGNQDRAKDLVQDMATWFYDWKPWLREGLSTYEASLRYTTKVMKNRHARQVVKDPLSTAVGLESITSGPEPKVPRLQRLAERRNLGIKALRLFKGDKRMQTFICLRFFSNLTRLEIADEMDLDPREVTDLGRRFRYRIRRERADKQLGLVPTKATTSARPRKKNDS
jgi:DNA-directed RNA polymerase specialized sigma24 family protein